jgi:hypothetical protein
MSWFEAMREIYTEGQLGNYVPTTTPQIRPTAPPLEIVPSVVPGGTDG